ncbi:HRDC domain-containing protein [Alkalilimnicola ehrlichii]|uniref:HRDC domain-containing protein n=1 Tax=Alkalilimnicola ehrlichii TaxID=351052 RepID=UPI00384D4A60
MSRRQAGHFDDPDSERLWEALRSCRRRIAEEQGVPPYVIFHDTTLMAMVEARPRSLSEMSGISGVGARKLELYGGEFIAAIAEHEIGYEDPP